MPSFHPRISIGPRVGIGFGIVLALLMAVGTIGHQALTGVERQFQT